MHVSSGYILTVDFYNGWMQHDATLSLQEHDSNYLVNIVTHSKNIFLKTLKSTWRMTYILTECSYWSNFPGKLSVLTNYA